MQWIEKVFLYRGNPLDLEEDIVGRLSILAEISTTKSFFVFFFKIKEIRLFSLSTFGVSRWFQLNESISPTMTISPMKALTT